jgi:hypothetical protein
MLQPRHASDVRAPAAALDATVVAAPPVQADASADSRGAQQLGPLAVYGRGVEAGKYRADAQQVRHKRAAFGSYPTVR